MTDRYIIDDAGTLIDIETRNTYDYVSDVCPLLNRLNRTIKTYKTENQQIKDTITEAYQNERTSLGKSVLKQLIKQME
jgi:phage gp36-like protein